MRIVFMGTPDFAVYPLEKLLSSSHEVAAVVTQPDRKRDKCKVTFSPVKEYALRRGIKVLQYEKVGKDGLDDVRSLRPDVIVTAAFGQMLSREFLEIPAYGVINVHASLLPKYRGSSPIQWAVIRGECETGVSIMKTAYEMDSGDIILQKKTAIGDGETAGELFSRLSVLGGDALIEALNMIENGTAVYTPQNSAEASYYPMLKKSDGLIDFSKTADEIKHFVAGMNPWPTAYFFLCGKMLKVFKVEKADGAGETGEIIQADKNGFVVACKNGAVKLTEVQPENGKRMTAAAYLAGHSVTVGARV